MFTLDCDKLVQILISIPFSLIIFIMDTREFHSELISTLLRVILCIHHESIASHSRLYVHQFNFLRNISIKLLPWTISKIATQITSTAKFDCTAMYTLRAVNKYIREQEFKFCHSTDIEYLSAK